VKIIGGAYREICCIPEWDQRFGSGGRAAAALSKFSEDVELHTYVPLDHQPEVAIDFATFDFSLIQYDTDFDFEFSYFHPMSRPQVESLQFEGPAQKGVELEADVALRFGMIFEREKASVSVLAEKAVYDPQSVDKPILFNENGSTANSLAYVLNERELRRFSEADEISESARELMKQERVDIVVVKRGPKGALVVTKEGSKVVPAYRSSTVFKIGSGDVFSAAFAYYWGSLGKSPEDAADAASRSAAWYCESRSLPLPDLSALTSLKPAPMGKAGPIYIASPFFNTSQRWLLEETRNLLLEFGAEVFSPLHDVGRGTPANIATADLLGLSRCAAVIALADGTDLGTIFEIGYARSRDIPVVVLSEALPDYELTMIEGTGCEIVSDFSSAVTRAYWASIR
jgi:hypothetical protein